MTARNRVNSPSGGPDSEDYLRLCQFAVEPSVVKLIEMATAAGWDRQHVAAAIALAAASAVTDERL